MLKNAKESISHFRPTAPIRSMISSILPLLNEKELRNVLIEVWMKNIDTNRNSVDKIFSDILAHFPSERTYRQCMENALVSTEKSKLRHLFVLKLIDTLTEIQLKDVISVAWKQLEPTEQILLRKKLKHIEKLDDPKSETYINCESDIEYRTRANSVQKEPELIEWIENSISEGDVFYDIGANVGAYSLIAAARLGKKIKIYSFEPSYLNFAQLVNNINLNNFEEIITPLPIALSQSTELNSMRVSKLVEGASFNHLEKYTGEEGIAEHKIDTKSTRHQSVMAFGLDECIETLKLPKPTHLKIDVDGFEQPLINGAINQIKSPTLRSIHIELSKSDKNYQKMLELFNQNGFETVKETVRGGVNINLWLDRK